MITGRRIWPSYGPSKGAASIRDALRALRSVGVDGTVAAAPLEALPRTDEPPRLEAAEPIEGSQVRVRPVPGAPVTGFGAFLDGIQRSRVLAHIGPVPIVHGAVAAAIRVRRDRRLHTWERPVVAEALYAPLAALPPGVAETLRAHGPVVDPDGEGGDPAARHPQEFTARALTAVQRAREAAEGELLAQWVREAATPLLVDGGISGSADAARAPWAVGVVKSHRTLYVGGDTLGLVLGLREGERTTAVVLTSPRRTPVASWYLRLRDASGRSPLFGLVRVEVARLPDPSALTARADEVSRWLLAERAPVALPDQRWDVMVYGIRECEQYLSAILR